MSTAESMEKVGAGCERFRLMFERMGEDWACFCRKKERKGLGERRKGTHAN